MNSGASFWVESLCKNIQLTLAFLKAPLLVLHVSCYTFMVLVMIISVILLFNLMILLSTLWSGIWLVVTTKAGLWIWIWPSRHCWVEQEVACWLQYWKTQLVSFYRFNNSGFTWKWKGPVLKKNNLWRCWACLSLLNWIAAPSLSLMLKLKLFFSWSTKRPYMEYSCHVWTRALICYLDVLDKLQKLVYRTVSSSIMDIWSSELVELVPLFILMGCLLVFLIGCMIFCHEFEMDIFVNCFFSRTGRLTLDFFCP